MQGTGNATGSESGSAGADSEALGDWRRGIEEKRLALEAEIYARHAEADLETFIEKTWSGIEPGRNYSTGWHIGALSEYLTAVSLGQIRRLIVNIPPRHMKSLSVCVFWPVWHWLREPSSRWIFSSYSAELSQFHAIKRRSLIASNEFARSWPGRINFREDEERKANMENLRGGTFRATSTGGTVGGQGGDFVVIDDPQDPRRGANQADRKEANNSVKYLAGTRLDNPKTGRVVLVQQRVHFDDQTATLERDWKESGDAYEKLSLPSPAGKAYSVRFPLSKETKEVAAGEALWPVRFGAQEIERARVLLGPYEFAGQFGQNPTPEGGAMVKLTDFRYLPTPPVQTGPSGWFWDTAFKESKLSDFSVGLHIYEFRDGYYISDLVRDHLGFPDLLARLKTCFAFRPSNVVGIEDKASGQDLIATIKKDSSLPYWGFKPTGDKVYRLSMGLPTIAAGRIFLPSGAPWVKTFVEEVTQFPKATHDDQVDALSMAIIWFLMFKTDPLDEKETAPDQNEFGHSLNKKDLW